MCALHNSQLVGPLGYFGQKLGNHAGLTELVHITDFMASGAEIGSRPSERL